MGKGSERRPRQIKQSEFDERWDAIFGKDTPSDTRINTPNSLRIDEESMVRVPRTPED
jgi:hypothetical protein